VARGFGLVVRAAGWHAGDPDVYPQRHEHSWDGYVYYMKVLISFFISEINKRDYRAWYGLGQTYEILKMPFYSLYYYRQAHLLK
jgi:hypothetical protein